MYLSIGIITTAAIGGFEEESTLYCYPTALYESKEEMSSSLSPCPSLLCHHKGTFFEVVKSLDFIPVPIS